MIKTLAGIESHWVQTSQMLNHILVCGDKKGIPLIFIHGNFSSASYFEELMLTIPDTYRCIAIDLRGYGLSEDLVIDATRGARDWSDDLFALLDTLNIRQAHLIGWSAGAAAVMQFMLDHSIMLSSATLIAPVSPYGFGGTKDLEGKLCYEDYAGSGGGVVPVEFVQGIREQDRSTDNVGSPRNVIRQLFLKPPGLFKREEDLLTASLLQRVGERRYPGDSMDSPNWPYTSPGRWGPINAVSAKYLDVSGIINLQHKPPILWIRGDSDAVISDRSFSDPAVLGEMTLLPDWPGANDYPAQPMVSQMRKVLEHYKSNAGAYREVVMADVGHSPFLENPNDFRSELLAFLGEV